MSSVDRWRARFLSESPQLPGAGLPWLDAIRQRAIERFCDLGWPTNRMESWRHTSLAFLAQRPFADAPVQPAGSVAAQAHSAATAAIERLCSDTAGHAPGVEAGGNEAADPRPIIRLVFIDGRFAAALSQLGELPGGARLAPLSQALAQWPHEVEAVFGQGSEAGEAAPAALNAALAADGAFLQLARGAVVEQPIHLIFVAAATGGASHPRNLILAQPGAQATVVEHYVGAGAGETLTNAVTRVQADADARIVHLKLQQEAEQAIHLAALDAVQARGSVFDSHSLSFGARLARHDIGTRFDGEACETLLNGLYHVDGQRHVDHHTMIDHARPRGVSREFYRGILDGAARGVFTGRIVVAPGAMRSDAVQRTDSLLLSARAEADARPELEIYADDVKCAHGATVGQIDESSLFYLRSRGLDEAHARNLLTWAFAAEALARIREASLRRCAESLLRARLPEGERLEVL